jgi:hypothetical protein
MSLAQAYAAAVIAERLREAEMARTAHQAADGRGRVRSRSTGAQSATAPARSAVRLLARVLRGAVRA